MLSLLHIENIALIQSADIRFEPGYNVLTGETGAGKSIVIDSIGAVLGERTSRELIRTGAKSALVTASVYPGAAPALAGGERHCPPRWGGVAPAGNPGGWAQRVPGRWTVGDGSPAAGAGPTAAEYPRPARRPAAVGPRQPPGISGPLRRTHRTFRKLPYCIPDLERPAQADCCPGDGRGRARPSGWIP